MFSPGSVSTSSGQKEGTAREMGVHLAKYSKTGGLVPAPASRILGAWEASIQALPAPGPPGQGPQEPPNALGPGREWGGPGSHSLHSAFTHQPCTHPASSAHPSLHHRFSGSRWFPPWPHPHPRGAGPGPDHPIAVLAQSHHVSPVTVRPPASSLPLLSAASLLLVPRAPCSLHASPTNLSWPLSPASFLPSAPHRDAPGPRGAPPPPPPLCALSLSRHLRQLQWR